MAMRALQQRIVDRDELDDSDDDGIMPGAPSAEEHLSFAEKLALRKEQRRALEDTEFDDAVTAINGIQVHIGIGNGLDQKVRQIIDGIVQVEFDGYGTRRDTEGRIFFFEILLLEFEP